MILGLLGHLLGKRILVGYKLTTVVAVQVSLKNLSQKQIHVYITRWLKIGNAPNDPKLKMNT